MKDKMKKSRLDTIIFLIGITAFGIINMLNPNKPTMSVQETRMLATKPVFSFSSLFSGKYFSGWNDYYSDTILLRDEIMQTNINVKKSFGLGKQSVSIVVVGNDQNTPTPTLKPTEAPLETQSSEPLPSGEVIETPTPSPEPTEEENTNSGEATGMYITIDGETFKLDDYSEEAYDNYAEYINTLKDMAGPDVEVYSMLAPSRGTYLALTKYEFLSSKAADADQINSKIDRSVKTVNVLKAIMEHVDEYIYYRTDHHWTHLGAYYGYCELMKTMGREDEIIPLEDYTETLFVDGYLGFYNRPYLTEADYKNPDTITAYYPIVDYTFTYMYHDTIVDKKLINKDRVVEGKDYYLLFSDGGFGNVSTITTSVKNGKTCFLIKDSFGDSLLTFLLPHYETIYVTDSRTYDKTYCNGLNIVDYAKEKGVDDIIVNYWITEITYIDDFMAKAWATLK